MHSVYYAGLNEHSSRYQYFAESLVKEGYAVYALDHVSHGKTEGQRHYVDDWQHWVENVIALAEACGAREWV